MALRPKQPADFHAQYALVLKLKALRPGVWVEVEVEFLFRA